MGKRFKFTPQKPGIIPKAKPGPHGRPRSPKVDVQYPLNVRGIAERGHRKARFRASFRTRVGRLPGLTDKFFRLFSMFLVCLVLFAVVTNSSYSTYQGAVGALYSFTETVGGASEAALSFVGKTIDWLTDDEYEAAGSYEDTMQTATVKVKIKGTWYDFYCKGLTWSTDILGRVDWQIITAPEKYKDWEGKKIKHQLLFWWMLPNADLKIRWNVKVTNVQNIEIEGE